MRRAFSLALAALAALSASACSSASFFVANLPVAFSDVEVHKNIAYGDGPLRRLDIYAPPDVREEGAAPAPVLVFFHGGRWEEGNKSQYAFAALPFVREGYVVVVPDYRKYPAVKFPAFVQDAAAATAWVHDHIARYGGDPERLYLAGHSSGAHMAALVAADPRYLEALGKERDIVAAFAGLAGPYDFVPEEPDLKDMFGPPERYPQMQVPTFIDGAQPPMLLLHGGADETVVRRNLTRLRDKIAEKGGRVETHIYEGVDHVDLVGALSWVLRDKAPVARDMMRFFEQETTK